MIRSDYYLNYKGPNLVKVIFGKNDITENVRPFYGENNNWCGNLWTYKEIFGDNSLNKKFRFEFKSDDGRDHWFHGFIHDMDQFMNPPLATPYNHSL